MNKLDVNSKLAKSMEFWMDHKKKKGKTFILSIVIPRDPSSHFVGFKDDHRNKSDR